MEDKGHDEERQANQAREGAEQQACCDAEPRWEGMRDRGVQSCGEGDAGEGEVGEGGRAERRLVGEEEGAKGGKRRGGGDGFRREKVYEPVRQQRGQ